MNAVDKLRTAAQLLEITDMRPSLYEIADEIEREIDGLHTQVRELKSLVRDLLGLVKMCDRDNIPNLDERIGELGIEGELGLGE